jgi:hypothetical protein
LHPFLTLAALVSFRPIADIAPGSHKGDVRALILICLALGIGACHGEQPLDCTKLDRASQDSCFERNSDKGEAEKSVACLPFSKPLMTSGIWVVGFEKSDFLEGWGARVPPGDVMWKQSTGADLIVDDEMLKKIAPNLGPQSYAFQVDVVGRRALCPAGYPNAYPISVEKLTVRRLIAIR